MASLASGPPVEVVAMLPGPASKANRGAADLLEAQLLACGVGSSVAVIEVHELQLACLLQGGHRHAHVTAVKWCPDCHSRDLKSHSSHLRLASGDAEGGVVVWSVLSGSVVSRMESHLSTRDQVRAAAGRIGGAGAAGAGNSGAGGGGTSSAANGVVAAGGVAGLAWVLSSPCVLAVLLSPGTLILWDSKGGAMLWRRELSGPDIWHGLEVDPLDCRRLAVSSSGGGVALVTLTGFGGGAGGREAPAVKQYRVGMGALPAPASPGSAPSFSAGASPPGSGASVSASAASSAANALAAAMSGAACTFTARFCATRDLLFLLLPREIIVFDTELGVPVGSRPLPPGRSPFSSLLGVFGSGVSAGGGDEGGSDVLYVGHADGGLSVFTRVPGELRYVLAATGRLTPPPVRGSTSVVTVLAALGALWRGVGCGAGAAQACAPPQQLEAASLRLREVLFGAAPGHRKQTPAPSASLQQQQQLGGPVAAADVAGGGGHDPLAAHLLPLPALACQPPQPPQPGTRQARHSFGGAGQGALAAHGSNAAGGAAGTGSALSLPEDADRPSVFLVAITADGRVWRWDTRLPVMPRGGTPGPSDVVGLSPPPPLPRSLQLPAGGTAASTAGPAEASAQPSAPQLGGLLHLLPSSVTALAIYPRPVAAAALLGGAGAGSGSCSGADTTGGGGSGSGVSGGGPATPAVLLGAVGTAGGSVELFSVQRGHVAPLSLHVAASFAAHRDAAVKGCRWLGASPRLVTFSSERGPHGGWANTVLITDVRSGRSWRLPREQASDGGSSGLGAPSAAAIGGAGGLGVGALGGSPLGGGGGGAGSSPGGGGSGGGEAAPLLGVRCSPCGCYLLVLVKGFPSELWGVWPGVAPHLLRKLELPLACVEWALPALPGEAEEDADADQAAEQPTVWSLSREPPPLASGLTAAAAAAAEDGAQHSRSSIFSVDTAPSIGGAAWPSAAGYSLVPTSSAAVDAARAGGGSGLGHMHAPAEVPGAEHGAVPEAAAAGGPPPAEAALMYSLTTSRCGFVVVSGKRVVPARVRRPQAGGLLSPLDFVASAMAACGRLVVMGDAEGRLVVWDWSTGRTTVTASGLGLIRRITLGPPVPPTAACVGANRNPASSPPHSGPAPPTPGPGPAISSAYAALAASWGAATSATSPAPSPFAYSAAAAAASPDAHSDTTVYSGPVYNKARVVVVSAPGACCVYDLDSHNRLRPTAVTSSTVQRAGVRAVLDAAWLPTTWIQPPDAAAAAGGGGLSLLAAVTDEGALAVLDVGPPPLPPSPPRPTPPTSGTSPAFAIPTSPIQRMPSHRTSLHAQDAAAATGGRVTADWLSAAAAAASGVAGPPHGGGGGVGTHRPTLLSGGNRSAALRLALQPQPFRPQPAGEDAGGGGGRGGGGGASGSPRLFLAPAPPLSSCLLLPRPWAMLLRLLLQLGVSQELLRYLCGPSREGGGVGCGGGGGGEGDEEEEDVRLELLARLPRGARGPLLELLSGGDRRGAGRTRSGSSVGGEGGGAVAAAGAGAGDSEGRGERRASAAAGESKAAAAAAAAEVPGATEVGPAVKEAAGAAGGAGTGSAVSGGLGSTVFRAVSYALNTLTAAGSTGGGAEAGGAGGTRDAPPTPPATAGGTAATAAAAQPGSTRGSPVKRGGGGAPGPAAASAPCGQPPIGGGGALRGNLMALLRHITAMRAGGRLLHPPEWLAYVSATAPGSSPADRMALAAAVAGDAAEAAFWRGLPATLADVRERRDELARQRLLAEASAGGRHHSPAASPHSAAHPHPHPPSYTPQPRGSSQPASGAGAGGLAAAGGSPVGRLLVPPLTLTLAAAATPAAHTPPGAPAATGAAPAAAAAAQSQAAAQLQEPPPALRSPVRASSQGAAAAAGPDAEAGAGAGTGAACRSGVRLWDERLALREAQERVRWHESLSRAVYDTSAAQQELRMLEYVALGDLQTAVAFLLAASPEHSARYYRDALCTLALAAAAAAAARDTSAHTRPNAGLHSSGGGGEPHSPSVAAPHPPPWSAAPGLHAHTGGGGGFGAGPGPGSSSSNQLLVQASKVVSAHAASIGDSLLGVPLHVAAGMYGEAAAGLQECGLWRCAATLTAAYLTGPERSAALARWAAHVGRQEGSVWRAAGLLSAAGCCTECLALLTTAGRPDCAAAYVEAVRHAGLTVAAPLLASVDSDGGGGGGGGGSAGGGGGDAWVLPVSSRAGSAGVPSGPVAAAVAAAAAQQQQQAAGAATGRYSSGGSGGGGGGVPGGSGGGWPSGPCVALYDALDQPLSVGAMAAAQPGGGGGGGGSRGSPAVDVWRAGTEFEAFTADLLRALL